MLPIGNGSAGRLGPCHPVPSAPSRRPRPVGAYGGAMAPDDTTLLSMFDTMALIAATDEALRDAISAGSATLAYYSPRGQEAVAAGCGAASWPRGE